MPRRLFATAALAVVSLAMLAGLAAYVSSSVAASLFAPGGLFDASRTGPVSLDLDGRQLRVTIGASHWTTDAGDVTKAWALPGDSGPFKAARSAVLLIQGVSPVVRMIAGGDPAYPRWDGSAWIFQAGAALPSTAPGPSHSGRLYLRNLTGTAVSVRVLEPDGSPSNDTTWSFGAYEAANDPDGLYLNVSGGGPLRVSSDERLEVTTTRGERRVLPLSAVGRWDSSACRIDLVPEYLAGRGNLYVKNAGDLPVRIWLIGADSKPLFGDDPWSFEPREGSAEDKGLRLTYNGRNISMTGRELVKTETQALTTLYQGPLEGAASWKGGTWSIDVSRFRGTR